MMLRSFTMVLAFALLAALLAGCAAPGPLVTQPTSQPGMGATEQTRPGGDQSAPQTPAVETEPAAPATPEPSSPAATDVPQPEPAQSAVVYIGVDDNLWLVDAVSGGSRPLTQDAALLPPGQLSEQLGHQSVTYSPARWSSDGKLLAYVREMGTVTQEKLEVQFALWVYDLDAGSARPVLELENQGVAGIAWKPGTNTIVYGPPVDPGYFSGRGQTVAELAKGIWAVDIDSGSPYELVKPERGYSLVMPRWSPDGRFLVFEEVSLMEGRGTFAYYDFQAGQYVAWDKVIGNYDWSPDGELIAYDELAYVANGTERIVVANRQDMEEQLQTPQIEQGYAFLPVFSPQGDRLAYWVELAGPESQEYTLFVQSLAGGEPESLGTFEQVLGLSWSPDGESLAFSAGSYEHPEVIAVTVKDGMRRVLAEGRLPAWQPAAP